MTSVAAFAAILVAFPLLLRPKYAIVVVVVAAVVWSAHRSVAWPVGLASIPAVLVALLGHNPLPSKGATIGIAAWTILAIGLALSRGVVIPARVLASLPVLATVGLAVLLVVRLGASQVPWYGSVKVQLFLVLDVLALFGGIFVGRDRRALLMLMTLWVVLAAVTAFALTRGLANGQAQAFVGGRYSIDQQNGPIGLSRDAARGILVAVALLLTGRGGWRQLLAFGTLPLIAVAFMASGSRGPVVGLVLGLLVLLALTVRDSQARRRVWLVGCGAVLAGVLVTQLVPGEDVQRALSVLTGSGGGRSSNGRSGLWASAASLFASHPLLGTGTGSFALYRPPELYPHNLFLEIAAELGVVGLVLVVAVVFGGGWVAWRAYNNASDEDRPGVALIAALFVSAVVNAQVSGDITTNSDVWLVAGLALGVTLRYRTAGSETAVWIRPWRRDLPALRPRTPSAGLPRRTPWQQHPGTSGARHPGEIVVPAEGAPVGGVVDVGGRSAETGWGVASVHLEFSGDGGRTWQSVSHTAGDATDVFRIVGAFREHVAIARTQRVAKLLVDELARLDSAADRYILEPSMRRPWQLGAGWSIEWDTGELPEGEYVLRAVTHDIAGSRVASPIRHVRVDASIRASGDRETELEIRASELEAAEASLRARQAEIEKQAASLSRRESDLALGQAGLGAAKAALEEARAELAARELALVARTQSVTRRELDLALRLRSTARAEPEHQGTSPQAADGTIVLSALERFAVERPDPDPNVQEERLAVIVALREQVVADGRVPAKFLPMLEALFGDLGCIE